MFLEGFSRRLLRRVLRRVLRWCLAVGFRGRKGSGSKLIFHLGWLSEPHIFVPFTDLPFLGVLDFLGLCSQKCFLGVSSVFSCLARLNHFSGLDRVKLAFVFRDVYPWALVALPKTEEARSRFRIVLPSSLCRTCSRMTRLRLHFIGQPPSNIWCRGQKWTILFKR